MKAVLQYRASAGLRSRLAARAPDWLAIAAVDDRDKPAFAREMADADVLFHVLEATGAAEIAAAPGLRLIQKIGVGLDTIDLDAARARGIAVANMPGANTQAVAEHALALMLATLRRIVAFDRAVREGAGWAIAPEAFDRLGEIGGRTVGLIGYGRVARALRPMLAAIGATVLVTGRRTGAGPDAAWRPRERLLAESDIVSLHLPLTEETRNTIDRPALGAMKRGAVLINTARGGLVDEGALIEALARGHLAGAGLDVFAREPVAAGHPLARLDTVVLAPHLAWLTPETLERSLAVAIENCRRLRDGEALLNRAV